MYHNGRRLTMREVVAGGAGLGTFGYPDRDTVHAYVELPSNETTVPYIACGLHGLIMWRRHHPETMDKHGGPSAVTCGRCKRVLGNTLGAAS